MSKPFAEEFKSIDARRDYSLCLDRLGDIYRDKKDYSKANRYYSQAMTIREELAEEVGSYNTKRDLSYSYRHLGDLYAAHGNSIDAKKYYEQAISISEALVNETAIIEAQTDLAALYVKAATISFPWDRSMLVKAHQIHVMLSKKYPHQKSFIKMQNELHKLIE